MKFNKEKPQDPHWGKNNAMHQYMLRVTQLESSLVEKRPATVLICLTLEL